MNLRCLFVRVSTDFPIFKRQSSLASCTQIMSTDTEQIIEKAPQPFAAFDPLRHNIAWDRGPLTRPPDPRRAIQFTPRDSPQKSREALGVWRRDRQAFKLFGTTNQYGRITNDIRIAIANDLPYAGASAAEGLVYTYENPTYRTLQGFAVIATWYDPPWTFFDGQGSWRPRFETIVRGATHNAQRGMQTAFRTAVRLRLSDPQGFIDPTTQSASNCIQFIDIHYGSPAVAEQMLEIVDAELGRRVLDPVY
jgi:hypothetical protein